MITAWYVAVALMLNTICRQLQVFWPLALIPCMMADCKTKSQIPVYGYPGGAPPVAAQGSGYPVVQVAPAGYPK